MRLEGDGLLFHDIGAALHDMRARHVHHHHRIRQRRPVGARTSIVTGAACATPGNNEARANRATRKIMPRLTPTRLPRREVRFDGLVTILRAGEAR